MGQKRDVKSLCGDGGGSSSCCKVESLITVDERGQMVLPKDVREKAGIAPGDKLAVVSWVQKGEICCLSLIKANDMVDYVKDLLGPMMEELIKK
jgi:antitoxin PrlF